MRIRISLLLLSVLLSAPAYAKLNVFACEPEWAALVKELGGDRVVVSSATTAYQDPHYIQARPSLIAKVRRADLLLCTGAGLEAGWLPVLLRKSGNARIQAGAPGYMEASDYVTMLQIPEVLDRSHGDLHAEGNPHVHLDPANFLLVAKALNDRLQKLDADNRTVYQMRYDDFVQSWRNAIDGWKAQITPLADVAVVSHHNYWPYLQQWAGFTSLAQLEPVPGVQPSSSHLAKLVNTFGKDVDLAVRVNYANERASNWLAQKLNVPVVVLQSTVDFQNDETLQMWFDEIVQRLVAASGAIQ